MVRLKEGLVSFNIKLSIIISIPYGAIKSENDFSFIFNSRTFQFLMVRLKEFVIF